MLRFDADDKEVVVQSTLEKSAAEKAGLRKDDIVLKVGDTDATDLLTTVNAVRRMKVGDEWRFASAATARKRTSRSRWE